MSYAGLLILGFGGHARSVADIALGSVMPCLRFYDVNARVGEQFNDFPAIPILPKVLPEGWAFLPAAGDNDAREQQLDWFAADRLATLISPRAYLGIATSVGGGSLVAHSAHLGPAVQVGRGVIINTRAIVDHESSIGDCSHVSVNASVAGRCRIERRVMVGAGATVRDGRCVGDDIVIGAGAVVVSDPSPRRIRRRPGQATATGVGERWSAAMRVLHFYKTYLPDAHGGAQQVIYEICEGTKRYGIDCEVLALTSHESDTRMVGRHRAHFQQRAAKFASTDLSMSAVGRFRDLAATADVVHYHFPWPMMDVAHFLVLHGKPSVVTYHSDIVRQRFLYPFYRPIMHRFLASADTIVATSPAYVRTSPVLRRYRDKVRVIPIGIDDAPLRNPDPALLQHWRAKVGSGFFLFIGVARYYKRLDVLLEAARGTGMPVVIAGADNDDRPAAQSRGEVRSDNVIYAGAISDADKAALLHLCNAIVLPSGLRSEAFGIVLLEGAMLSKPLICCELGTGTTYVNVDGLTGFAVPPGDASELRAAMRRLHDNPDLARQLGHNARKRYLDLFTGDRMARKYAEVYEQVSGLPMHLMPSEMRQHALPRYRQYGS